MNIELPVGARELMERFMAHGFFCYAVGGCVRDSLLGKKPTDWDLCTTASPDEILACCTSLTIIPTGISHGTVTILMEDGNYEVTACRTEEGYSDHRHPDTVHFVRNIYDDLRRRDFTVNAMAYRPEDGLIDPYGGLRDLRAGQLVCVGDPKCRFEEDPLRILRAIRFASVLEFSIERKTEESLRRLKESLCSVSAERVREEICKLMVGNGVHKVLLNYPDVIGVILPEILLTVGFDQKNPHHHLDVWKHTVETVSASPPDRVVRLAALLHDLGKPHVFTVDEKGIGHCYGHDEVSANLAERVLLRLRFSKAEMKEIKDLVALHGADWSNGEKSARRWLNRMGESGARRLISLKRADCMAQAPAFREERLRALSEFESILERCVEKEGRLSLHTLAVNGKDVMDAGIPEGKKVGEVLHKLLESTISGRLPNERAALLASIQNYAKRSEEENYTDFM